MNNSAAPGAPVRTRTRSRRWLTVLLAVAVAVAVWTVAVPLLDLDLVARPGGGAPQQIGLGAVTAVSLLAGLGSWLLLAVLEKWTRRARVIWRVIAVLVLVVSLLGPLSAASGAAMAVLVALHLVVGGILVWGLPRPAAVSQS
jgi:hypothetical protein